MFFCTLPVCLLPCFILRWSIMTGDIITPHGSWPRHQELLYLQRWLCVSVFVCVYSIYGRLSACLSYLSLHISATPPPSLPHTPLSLYDHWQMVCTLFTHRHTHKSIRENSSKSWPSPLNTQASHKHFHISLTGGLHLTLKIWSVGTFFQYFSDTVIFLNLQRGIFADVSSR